MTYQDALQVIIDRTENLNGDNPEYERGMLEMAADLFGTPEMFTDERVEEIRADALTLARIQAVA